MASKTRNSSSKNPLNLAKAENPDSEIAAVSLKELENVVDKTIKKYFDGFKTEMKALFDAQVEKLEARIRDLESDLNIKSEKLLELELKIDALESRPTGTSDNLVSIPQLEEVKKNARHATVIANDCEQYSRRNNVRIRGLRIPDGKTLDLR